MYERLLRCAKKLIYKYPVYLLMNYRIRTTDSYIQCKKCQDILMLQEFTYDKADDYRWHVCWKCYNKLHRLKP